MAYPDKINALVDVSADETLAAGGHAARHNDVNEALEEVRDVLGGGTPITATDNTALEFRRDNVVDVIVHRASTNAGGPFLGFRKSRGTHASPAVVAENDILGTIGFQGYSAALGGRRQAAEIRGVVDGEPDTAGDTSDMPGRLEFRTTPDGSASRVERMRLTSGGSVLIGTTTPGSAGAGDLVVNGGVFLGGSAAANELDDYEEGTWTPVVDYSVTSPTVTHTRQNGEYIKIGHLVWAQFDVVASSITGGSGSARISGLPFFSNVSTSTGASTPSFRVVSGLIASGTGVPTGFVSGDYLHPQTHKTGGTLGLEDTNLAWDASCRITGHVVYQTT